MFSFASICIEQKILHAMYRTEDILMLCTEQKIFKVKHTKVHTLNCEHHQSETLHLKKIFCIPMRMVVLTNSTYLSIVKTTHSSKLLVGHHLKRESRYIRKKRIFFCRGGRSLVSRVVRSDLTLSTSIVGLCL